MFPGATDVVETKLPFDELFDMAVERFPTGCPLVAAAGRCFANEIGCDILVTVLAEFSVNSGEDGQDGALVGSMFDEMKYGAGRCG